MFRVVFSGVVLVVFGVLVLVHGASLGGSGAGLWAGAGALVAGALGVVATLATSSTKTNSAFSSAHLASSLIALALSNMAAITALTAVVRDSQRTPEVSLLSLSVRPPHIYICIYIVVFSDLVVEKEIREK